MTKAEAREYALRVLAAEARHHIGNGSDWLLRPHGRAPGARIDSDGYFSGPDMVRIETAVEEIATSLEGAAERLQRSRPSNFQPPFPIILV